MRALIQGDILHINLAIMRSNESLFSPHLSFNRAFLFLTSTFALQHLFFSKSGKLCDRKLSINTLHK